MEYHTLKRKDESLQVTRWINLIECGAIQARQKSNPPYGSVDIVL